MELSDAFDQLFQELRDEVKKEIRSNSFAVRGRFRRVLSPSFWRDKVNTIIRPVIERMFREGEVFDREAVQDHVNVAMGRAESYSERVGDAVEQLAETSTNVNELAAAVDEIPLFSDQRARLWADVEEWAVEQHIILLQETNKGMQEKTWRTQLDDRVRDTHGEMEGVRVPINHLFQLPGGTGMFPGDPTLPPEERVNCRCFLQYG